MSADNPQDGTGTTGSGEAATLTSTSTTIPPASSGNARDDRRPQSGISIIALTIGIVALAASGYVWYATSVTGRLQLVEILTRAEVIAEEFDDLRSSQQAAFVDRTAIYRQLENDRRELQDELRSLDTRAKSLLSQFEKQQNDTVRELQKDVNTLTRSMERTRQEIGRVADDWVLEEMAQLLLFATERLQLTGDVALALRALQLAEVRLGEIADPALLSLRRQLTRDIVALAAVSLPDINGVVLRLSTLIDNVHGLSVAGDLDAPKFGNAADSEQDTKIPDTTLTGLGRRLMEDFGALVKIRNVEETQLPSLEPEQRRLVFESLRLPLSAAQLALLRNLPGVYRDSLARAQVVLDSRFNRNAADVIAFHSAIEELLTVEVVYRLPDISGSLNILREKLRNRSEEE